MFPVWLLFMFPITWLIVIPANFLIDSLVLLLASFLLKINEKWEFYKRTVLWVFLFGFAADLIGGFLLLLTQFIGSDGWFYEFITASVAANPFDNIYSLLYTVLAVLVSAVLIYVFNRFVSFRKVRDIKIRRVTSLLLAVLTAPYLFLYPTSGIYGGQVESFTNHIVWGDYVSGEVYLADSPEDDIMVVKSGEHFDYGLISAFRDAVNTAERTDKTLPKEWKYKVVFSRQEAGKKSMEPICIFESGGSLIFEWNGRVYCVDNSSAQLLIQRVNEHINPPVIDEEVSQ